MMRHRSPFICRCASWTLVFSLLCAGALPLAARQSVTWEPLAETYTPQQLGGMLLPQGRWDTFATHLADGDPSLVPAEIRTAYIHAGEALLDASWPALPATVFLEYVRNGNRSDYEKLSFARRRQLATLVLAETMEGRGRFLDQIINGIWAICEESFWGVPAHLNLQKAKAGLPDVEDPAVDLFAAETAQEMAWTYYLLKKRLDSVNPLIARRIVLETRRRILWPYLRHRDWGYLGYVWKAAPAASRRVNNWNPWINSNVLVAALILADDSLRNQVVYKTMESVDNFVIPYPADGGSDEGPEYWGRAAGALLDYLEVLHRATGGRINAFGQPVVRRMGGYIYKMSISYPYFINYGDADPVYRPDPSLLYRFGRATDDTLLMHFAAYQARRDDYGHGVLPGSFGVLNRSLLALRVMKALRDAPPDPALVRDVWLPDIQVMAARSVAGSDKGLYLAAKGGDNGVSHNHNDVGNVMVYLDGKPVLVDAGAQTYTAQTFGGKRYELWNNQSAYHNLPDINGIMQKEGAGYGARDTRYHAGDQRAVFSLELAGAYPAAADVRSFRRQVVLERGRELRIEENYRLNTWKAPITENFLSPWAPDIHSPGTVWLQGADPGQRLRLLYDASRFQAAVDTVVITDGKAVKGLDGQLGRDGRMYGNWGPVLYRLRLVSTTQKTKDHYTFTIKR